MKDESPAARRMAVIKMATHAVVRAFNESNLTRTELASRMGTTRGYISQLFSGDRNMSLRTICDLCTAMDRRVVLKAIPLDGPVMEEIELPMAHFAQCPNINWFPKTETKWKDGQDLWMAA